MQGVQKVHVSEVFTRQCVDLIRLTREHKDLEVSCSPRAGLSIAQAARARAYIYGRDYVIPEDLYALAEDVILHRIRLNYEALAEGRKASEVLKQILTSIS